MDDNPSRATWAVALLTATAACGGGMVAAIGPSIEAFARSTGLDPSQLGTAVMAGRLAKMVGLLAWTVYAQALQQGQGRVPPPRVAPHVAPGGAPPRRARAPPRHAASVCV